MPETELKAAVSIPETLVNELKRADGRRLSVLINGTWESGEIDKAAEKQILWQYGWVAIKKMEPHPHGGRPGTEEVPGHWVNLNAAQIVYIGPSSPGTPEPRRTLAKKTSKAVKIKKQK